MKPITAYAIVKKKNPKLKATDIYDANLKKGTILTWEEKWVKVKITKI